MGWNVKLTCVRPWDDNFEYFVHFKTKREALAYLEDINKSEYKSIELEEVMEG